MTDTNASLCNSEKSPQITQRAGRNQVLDMGRYFAALVVVFYHYAFIGPAIGKTGEASFTVIVDFAKYGYLGVSFFFLISGYVIFQSAQNGIFRRFVASRISRLYPAYWIAVPIGFFAALSTPGISDNHTTLSVFVNMTMLQGFVGVNHIDNVYWTLTVEIMFYGLISALLIFNCLHKLTWVALTLLAIATIHHTLGVESVVYLLAQPDWAPYFMVGCAFYWLRSQSTGKSLPLAILAWGTALCLYQANIHTESITAYTGYALSSTIAVSATALFISLFGLMVFFGERVPLAGAAMLGAISYPLYLLHQNVGYALLTRFATPENSYALAMGITAVLVIFSACVVKLIEEPMRKPLHSATLTLIDSVMLVLYRISPFHHSDAVSSSPRIR